MLGLGQLFLSILVGIFFLLDFFNGIKSYLPQNKDEAASKEETSD